MFKLVALSAAAALVGAVSALTVNTPASLVQCQPALLSWSDGTGPYYLAIIPGGQPSAAALENLPTQQGTTYTWTVDLAAGQSVTLKITDSTGTINYSDKVTIQAGTSTTCGASSSSGSAVAAGSSSRTSLASSATSAAASVSSAAPASSSSAAATLKMTTSASSAIGAAGNAATGISVGSSSSTPATTSSTKTGGATTLKAASGLALGALVFALAA